MKFTRRFLFFVLLFALASAGKAAERPNFLFILADDQAPYSIGAYGNEVCQTPNIDAIAQRGMRFDGAYHMGAFQGAVCTASRHMIMSGRTLWHIPGAVSRNKVLSQLHPEQKYDTQNRHIPAMLEASTLAAVFNQAGYDTMRTCKRGNSYAAANRQFQIVREATNRKVGPDGSRWHAEQVLEYLTQRAETKDEDPFLIYFGFSHPHDPRYASEENLTKYGATNEFAAGGEVSANAPALPANYLAEHPFHHGHPGLRDEVAVQGVMERRDEATIRNEKGREYACIENMDAEIGRVLQRLEAMGELENTYVIFTADHGIAVGRHGLMGKQNLYEHSWRVPYVVAGPGIKPGTAQGNIYLLDTLATLCDLASIEAPATNEGISFRPVLEGRQDTIRDVLYGCYCGGTKPGMRSVRKGDWKLIRYETLDGEVQETQLFNLAANPDELLEEHHQPDIVESTGNVPTSEQRDLAEDPKYAEQLKEMEALLLAEMERHDDPYRFGEGYRNPPKKQRKKRQ